MMKLMQVIGATVGGWAGWDIGQPGGTGLAFAISSLGSVLGVIPGWWLVRRYLD